MDSTPEARSSRSKMLHPPPVTLLERGMVETSSLPLTPRLRGSTTMLQLPVVATAGAVSPLVSPAGIEAPTLPFERVGLVRKTRHCLQVQ